jgi:hypothetical protein
MITKNNIPYWDIACKLEVCREAPNNHAYPMGPIDPGINFFVLALEELDAATEYSCEGHPETAYVSFKAPLRLGKDIHLTGTFFVLSDESSESRPDDICDFAMYARDFTRVNGRLNIRFERDVEYTEETRVTFLRQSAEVWMHYFGDRLSKLRKTLEDKMAELAVEELFYRSTHP